MSERLCTIIGAGEKAGQDGHLVTPASVNKEVSTLRRIFNLAIREDLVSKNPCWKVEKLPENNARKRVLSQDELDRLLPHLPQHARDIVLIGYYTGMRLGEILGLTWGRIHLQEGFIQLEASDTKTKHSRKVHLDPAVRNILSRLQKVRHLGHNRVFTYKGEPVKSLKTCLNTAHRAAGIQNFRFHDLRHTFTTMMRKAGVPPRTVIMAQTGHRTHAMFERYDAVDDQDVRNAFQRLDEYLEASRNPEGYTHECSHSAPKGSKT